MRQAYPSINMVKTGEKIETMRKAAGLSVKDLQQIFGFSTPQAIYKWQKGTALPTLDNMVLLAYVLGVKVDDILVKDEDVSDWMPLSITA